MEQLLDQIRAALATDAAEDSRAAGALACRTILAALDAKAGEVMQLAPSAAPPQAAPAAGSSVAATHSAPVEPRGAVGRPSPVATVQALAAALRGMPTDQLLDMAITRLRAAVPGGAAVTTAQAVRFNLVPLGSTRGSPMGDR